MTTTAEGPLGVLRPDGDRTSVRFERTYATEPADLWEAMTSPARLARWLGTVTGDLREGGRYHVVLGSQPDDHAAGDIHRCRAPQHLRVGWTWPGEELSEVELEVSPDPAGARLVLTHHRLPRASAVGYGAGWHAYLDVLAGTLPGTYVGPAGAGPDGGAAGTGGEAIGDDGSGGDGTWDERFAALLPRYRVASGG